MAITKLIISIEDSNDMDSTTSPHSPDKVDSGTIKGVENPIILQGTVGRSGRLCLWWKYGLKSEQINDDLLKPFTLEDIKCAVLQMEGLKAAEPDGFHGNFYHSCSEIVNKIISRSISEFSSLRDLRQGDTLSPFLFLFIKKDISSLISDYCEENKRKIRWRNWPAVCASKSVGGVGFKSLFYSNTALLAKQFWRLISKPTASWARVLRGRYFPWEMLSMLPRLESAVIEATLLGDLSHSDRLIWPWYLNGNYSVKSGYAFCLAISLNNHLLAAPSASHYVFVDPVFWKLIWGMKIIPKIKIFF
ncbi:hypothetical protein ACFX13_030959 [Malus domestica]